MPTTLNDPLFAMKKTPSLSYWVSDLGCPFALGETQTEILPVFGIERPLRDWPSR